MFLKQGCESGRQWGFVTFATAEEAQFAQAGEWECAMSTTIKSRVSGRGRVDQGSTVIF